MKLWIGAETQSDVVDSFRLVRSGLEREINLAIAASKYDIGVDSWDCIAILRNDGDFKEATKFYGAKREMDFRLRLDYRAFVDGDIEERKKLLFQLLLRSLKILETKVGNSSEIKKFLAEVTEVGITKKWIAPDMRQP